MDEEILPGRGARFGARHPAASRRVGRAAHCRLGTLEGRSCRAVHGPARPPLRAGTANGGCRDQCRRPNRKSPARTPSGRAVLSYTVWSWSRDFHASPEIIPPDRHAHSQRLPGNECRTAPTALADTAPLARLGSGLPIGDVFVLLCLLASVTCYLLAWASGGPARGQPHQCGSQPWKGPP